MDLNILWFCLLGALLAGYAVLDGFDLGVGILHFQAKSDAERRVFMNAIGPIWDGNEVWLVAFAGATFAAFPDAYATIFSGFYELVMLVLLSLICRAVSLEFRSKVASPGWRHAWDRVFFGSSLAAAFVYGTGVGNAMFGIPLDARGVHTGSVLSLLNPYGLMVGLLTTSIFSLHGGAFLYLKTEGDLQSRVHGCMKWAYLFFLLTFLITTALTFTVLPRATANFGHFPWAWGVVGLMLLAMIALPLAIKRHAGLSSFVCTSVIVLGLVFLFGMGLYPNLVTSTPNPEYSLTLVDAASSQKTLGILTVVAVLGLPFVFLYTVIVYRVFRGKVRVDKMGY
jgi:cytochrome d ubiquinol oxidase subunit II